MVSLVLYTLINDNIVVPRPSIRIQTATLDMRARARPSQEVWQVLRVDVLEKHGAVVRADYAHFGSSSLIEKTLDYSV